MLPLSYASYFRDANNDRMASFPTSTSTMYNQGKQNLLLDKTSVCKIQMDHSEYLLLV